jgi:hypothetical protein
MRSAHWRVYAVANATPIAQGAATLTAMGPDWVTLAVRRPGTVTLHVRFTPYWAVVSGSGCVAPGPDGLTQVTARHAGAVRLGIRFALDRVRARSPRCA